MGTWRMFFERFRCRTNNIDATLTLRVVVFNLRLRSTFSLLVILVHGNVALKHRLLPNRQKLNHPKASKIKMDSILINYHIWYNIHLSLSYIHYFVIVIFQNVVFLNVWPWRETFTLRSYFFLLYPLMAAAAPRFSAIVAAQIDI